MKNEILDAPFRESFSDFLEKGEKLFGKILPSILNMRLLQLKQISFIQIDFI
mgnify:CR=1 FL=1